MPPQVRELSITTDRLRTNIAAQKNNDNICEESRNVCISKNMDTATKKLARFDICDLYNKDNDELLVPVIYLYEDWFVLLSRGE